MADIPARTALTKSGRTVRLRSPGDEDAEALLGLHSAVIKERDYMVALPAEITTTLAEERTWIRKICQDENSLAIVAECDARIVGMLDFHGRNGRSRIEHTGTFGINVRSDNRSDGIGLLLLNELEGWVRSHPTVRKIGLAVFATNTRAICLYKKLGFLEEGRRIKEIQTGAGTFIDDILMFKWVEDGK